MCLYLTFPAFYSRLSRELGVNCDVLESLNPWIIRPKLKCALLLSWGASLPLFCSSRSFSGTFPGGCSTLKAMGTAPPWLVRHQVAPEQLVSDLHKGGSPVELSAMWMQTGLTLKTGIQGARYIYYLLYILLYILID